MLALVAQLDAPSDWRLGGRGFNPRQGRQHSFVEIDHEIFSMVILSLLQNAASDQGLHCLPLIQQFLVRSTGIKMDLLKC